MFKKRDKKKGWCFVIEGFAGSGKTTTAKNIFKSIEKLYGKTVILDGHDIRYFFKGVGRSFGFSKAERTNSSRPTGELINLFLNQNINIIHPSICLNNKVRKIYEKKINNLIIILIKTNVKDIIRKGIKKHVYKLKKNVVGIHILPEFPRNPDIVINNNLKKPLKHLSKELIDKLKKLKINKS